MLKTPLLIVIAMFMASMAAAQSYTIVIGQNSSSMDEATSAMLFTYFQDKGFSATVVRDSNFVDDGKSNIISVGGSCINHYSATLLSVPYPTCGSEFTNMINVSQGQYIIRSLPISNSRTAIVIAGYEGQDTRDAANFLMNQTPQNFSSMNFIGMSSNDSSSSGNMDYNIEIDKFAFTQSAIVINIGDTVTWTNNQAGVPHTVTSDTGSELSSQTLNKGASYSHTFTKAGTYNYHCSIHPSMQGTVIVASG